MSAVLLLHLCKLLDRAEHRLGGVDAAAHEAVEQIGFPLDKHAEDGQARRRHRLAERGMRAEHAAQRLGSRIEVRPHHPLVVGTGRHEVRRMLAVGHLALGKVAVGGAVRNGDGSAKNGLRVRNVRLGVLEQSRHEVAVVEALVLQAVGDRLDRRVTTRIGGRRLRRDRVLDGRRGRGLGRACAARIEARLLGLVTGRTHAAVARPYRARREGAEGGGRSRLRLLLDVVNLSLREHLLLELGRARLHERQVVLGRVHLHKPFRVGSLRNRLQGHAAAHEGHELCHPVGIAHQVILVDTQSGREERAQVDDVEVEPSLSNVARPDRLGKVGHLGRQHAHRLRKLLVGRDGADLEGQAHGPRVHEQEDGLRHRGLAVGRADDHDDRGVLVLRLRHDAKARPRPIPAVRLGGQDKELARVLARDRDGLEAQAKAQLPLKVRLDRGKAHERLVVGVARQPELHLEGATSDVDASPGHLDAFATRLEHCNLVQQRVERRPVLKEHCVVVANALHEGAHHVVVDGGVALVKMRGVILEEQEPLQQNAQRARAMHDLLLGVELVEHASEHIANQRDVGRGARCVVHRGVAPRGLLLHSGIGRAIVGHAGRRLDLVPRWTPWHRDD
ncbi:MAG: hypothetical protein CL844_06505 [Crocinitomicaceae bacterium]|nr:hypothetical protein [Crocinitomicaceae bacterium]